MYNKNDKKSIYNPEQIDCLRRVHTTPKQHTPSLQGEVVDIFILISVLVLITVPLIINIVKFSEKKNEQVILILSPRFEEFFGKETTEIILKDFNERNRSFQIIMTEDNESRSVNPVKPCILIFDNSEYSGYTENDSLKLLNPYIYIESEGGKIWA
jgi:hypothetical protein